jgi:two-component system response regulator YesN
MAIAIVLTMSKMLIISKDNNLTKALNNTADIMQCEFYNFSNSTDSLDIASEIFSINPSLLIIDDDFTAPNSAKLLESVKKVNSKLQIIFITSDTGLELGRKINKIGVKYYLIKPIDEDSLTEFIKSVKTENEQYIN